MRKHPRTKFQNFQLILGSLVIFFSLVNSPALWMMAVSRYILKIPNITKSKSPVLFTICQTANNSSSASTTTKKRQELFIALSPS